MRRPHVLAPSAGFVMRGRMARTSQRVHDGDVIRAIGSNLGAVTRLFQISRGAAAMPGRLRRDGECETPTT